MSSIACSYGAPNLERHPTVGRETRDVHLVGVRRALSSLSTKWLRDHVDEYLVAWEQARERGDDDAIVRAEAEWNAVWDEIDWRDAMASEVAS
jgi:hypothetical protein